MLDEERQITVIDDKGNEHLMQIFFTYENKERGTKYVFIYDEKAPDEVYPMRYNDKNELSEIEDPDEYAEVEEVFNAYEEDPEIQKLKEN